MSSAPEAAEILRRCDLLATQSSRRGAIERVYLSPEHAAVNRIVGAWMAEAGMTVRQDEAGNLVGRYEASVHGRPALLLGSHLDSVPDAGRYDGILGVLLAIATVARLASADRRLPVAIEVLAFGDEEGTRFGATLLGSRAVAGTWREDWWALRDADGVTLAEAFRAFGLDPAAVGAAARTPADVVGYLEAHIEQGPLLEDAGLPLAVVSSIAGARRLRLTVTGEARHAGGTPFDRRRDALVGASEIVVAIERIARATGAIATVGTMEVEPGAVNVIPGRAAFGLDLRAETDALRDEAWRLIRDEAVHVCRRRGLGFDAHETHAAGAAIASPALRDAVSRGIAAATGDGEPPVLFSKAGHDAMAIADLTDWAMLFVRCAGGISHHPDESVAEADVAVALDAFEAAVVDAALAAGAELDPGTGETGAGA